MTAIISPPTAAPSRHDAGALMLTLEQATALHLVGGKAFNLRRAASLGVFVPPGTVLTTTALESHLAEHRLRQAQVADLALLVAATPLSEHMREVLFAATDALLAEGPVVVRSSAIGEDSARESFAGQFDSILNVRTRDELEGAVRTCWASCWSERVLAYRASRGTRERGMAVIVQRQVDALAAGVLFTRAGDDRLLIEYTPGLGNELVAGEVDPGRFSLQRDGSSAERLQSPEHFDPRVERLISSASILQAFAQIAQRLEHGMGVPQDVEWALDAAGAIHVVQTRPITAHVPSPPRARETRIRWSNANVNENFPAPISPLLYSIASAGYAHYFRSLARAFGLSRRRIAALDDALRHIIGVHGARMYYNLTNIHTVLRAAPFGDALVAAFNGFVGASGSEGAARRSSRRKVRESGEVAWIALKTAWTYRTLGRRVAAFERQADDFAARSEPHLLETLSARDLRLLLAEFMDIRCHRWTNAALADAAAMVCYAALHRLVERATPDSSGLHNTLLKAIPNLVSGEPVQRLWNLSRRVRQDAALSAVFRNDANEVLRVIRSDTRFADFRAEFDEYLTHCGFRCSAELMLTVPSYQEDPAPLIDTVRAYARLTGESPAEALARQLDERTAETSRLLEKVKGRRLSRHLPFVSHSWALRVALRWTQASIAFRERARLKQALLYSRCRRIALTLGDRLVERGVFTQRDDVFWLTAFELDELTAGASMFPHAVRDLIELRRSAHARLAALAPADSFTLPDGEYLSADGALHQAAGSETGRTNGHMQGTSACGGRATGRAVVLADVREAARLSAGDILVTRQTDPGWAPVFFLIKGLVIERGGMLSHGAIVAREFGIPCVVGVRNATTTIADGRTILVDGDAGAVHVLD
jgi:phosphohistidine swiveling domain-containing protein